MAVLLMGSSSEGPLRMACAPPVLPSFPHTASAGMTRGRARAATRLIPGRAAAPLDLHYRLPEGCCVSFSITWSMPKLAGFWRGGNSLKLCSQFTTNAWAGTSRKTRSIRQRL